MYCGNIKHSLISYNEDSISHIHSDVKVLYSSLEIAQQNHNRRIMKRLYLAIKVDDEELGIYLALLKDENIIKEMRLVDVIT